MTTWTKPYCGVQHLEGINPELKRQITITNRESFVECVVINRRTFGSLASGTFDTLEKAKAWGESQASIWGQQ